MDRVWLKNYPENVPHEIQLVANESLARYVADACHTFSQHDAYVHFGCRLSYRSLWEKSQALASFLQKKLHINKGDRVAIMLPNCMQYSIAMFACLAAGAVVVNVNPLYTKAELSHLLKDSGASVLIAIDLFGDVVEQALAENDTVNLVMTSLGDLLTVTKKHLIQFVLKHVKREVKVVKRQHDNFLNALTQGKQLMFEPVDLSAADLAFLQYTGGTTGVPKGVKLSHGNMLANMKQISAWFTGFLNPGKEINVLALPLYHIFSLTVNCFMMIGCGGCNVIVTNPRDLKSLISIVAKYPITFFIGVNTLFNKLLERPDLSKLNFKHLKVSVAGGMPVHEKVAKRWEQATKAPLLEGYGLTEASPVVAVNPLNKPEFNGSIGMPLPSTEIKFIDDNGVEIDCQTGGELCVKGPQVMQGYWQQEGETAQVLSSDGWLSTGDVGYLDEQGLIFLRERKKDIIIVSGFNVYPSEVEDVIAKHPGVSEVAVVGIPDESHGEVVKAVIVAKEEVSEDDLLAWCQQSLTRYKLPRRFEFIDELPKTPVGKVLRRELR